MRGVLVAGTASDVGETMICTALCRILKDEGINTAPFKSQNMPGFSAALPDGREISRSQLDQQTEHVRRHVDWPLIRSILT